MRMPARDPHDRFRQPTRAARGSRERSYAMQSIVQLKHLSATRLAAAMLIFAAAVTIVAIAVAS